MIQMILAILWTFIDIPGFIKQIFIVLVLLVLGFGGLLTAKCISKNNQPYTVRMTLIDLNLNEIHYYPFMVSLDRFGGRCDTVEDPFGRIYIPSEVEDVNLKVFNIIKGMDESKTLVKHISCECRCEVDGRKCNSKQEWNNDKFHCV